MSGEVIEVGSWKGNDSLPVTKSDLTALEEKRKVLREFVTKQLKEGIDGDYGKIPGAGNKKVLLQPGAEKLSSLFGLGSRMNQVSQVFDRAGNFAMFTYKCEIFHLKTGASICEVEGTANSQEKKYATKSVWEKRGSQSVKTGDEPVPIADIANTLMKMAQKRAFIGAVVKATNASDFFTVDTDTPEDFKNMTAQPELKEGESPVSFGVGGDTMTHKDELKKYGAKWNQPKSMWVFSNVAPELKKKVSELKGVTIHELT